MVLEFIVRDCNRTWLTGGLLFMFGRYTIGRSTDLEDKNVVEGLEGSYLKKIYNGKFCVFFGCLL